MKLSFQDHHLFAFIILRVFYALNIDFFSISRSKCSFLLLEAILNKNKGNPFKCQSWYKLVSFINSELALCRFCGVCVEDMVCNSCLRELVRMAQIGRAIVEDGEKVHRHQQRDQPWSKQSLLEYSHVRSFTCLWLCGFYHRVKQLLQELRRTCKPKLLASLLVLQENFDKPQSMF